jgi:uncharacterized protein (UPF0276 family)
MQRASHGFGLRVPHYAEILQTGVRADFAEAITENFVARGGRPLAVLERVRRDIPVVLHGVSLSIGGTDPLNRQHIARTKELAQHIDAAWISDHLCFGTHAGHYAHDLWPLPYTEEALTHVVERVREVQALLGQRILLENVSSYVEHRSSSLREWEFLSEVATHSDCDILLDLNNVYVSAKNHNFSPFAYLDALPMARIRQLHLAGHSDKGTYLLDDHGSAVPDCVWELYRYCCAKFGPIPTLIEWDDNIPSLSELAAECDKARYVQRGVCFENAHAPGGA